MKDRKRARSVLLIVLSVALLTAAALLFLTGNDRGESGPLLTDPSATVKDFPLVYKPVIYLYPPEETDVAVSLDYGGALTVAYPAYRDGWRVTAWPDGRLVDRYDGREYSYLFWEGEVSARYDFASGFVVKGGDTADFLRDALTRIGLTPREYNEFIVYWLPRMQENAYNLISFQGEAYTQTARLTVTPKPDSLLRVFMAYKPLEAPVDVPPQELAAFTRTGFTVIEWGGCEVN